MSSSIAMIAIMTLLLFAMKPVIRPVFQHLQTLSREIDPQIIADCAANFQPKCAEVDNYSPEVREALEWFNTHFDQLKNLKHHSNNPNGEEQLKEFMRDMRDFGQAPVCALYGILALSDMRTDANGQMCLNPNTRSIFKRRLGEVPERDIDQGTQQDIERDIEQGTQQDIEQSGVASSCPCLGANSCSKLSRRSDRNTLLLFGLLTVLAFAVAATLFAFGTLATLRIPESDKLVNNIQGLMEENCDPENRVDTVSNCQNLQHKLDSAIARKIDDHTQQLFLYMPSAVASFFFLLLAGSTLSICRRKD
eukprot:NODE_295_length_11479_cov_0.183480.p3 type:complete len:307 gc:universal NODE_295_length_11479_cov_0.183480:4252-3332(-)